jgi:DNA-binding FadR family transcriptional regulator
MKIQDVRRMWKFLHIRNHREVGNNNSEQSVQREEVTEGAKIRTELQHATEEAIKIITALSERMLQGKFRQTLDIELHEVHIAHNEINGKMANTSEMKNLGSCTGLQIECALSTAAFEGLK